MRKFSLRNKSLHLITTSVALAVALLTQTLMSGTATGGEKGNWKKQNGQKQQAIQKTATKQFVLKKELAVNPGGTLMLEADRGSIEIIPGNTNRVAVEVIRSISEKYVTGRRSNPKTSRSCNLERW